jgi:hypothetical protein
MRGTTIDQENRTIGQLLAAAEDFAERARVEEARRDRERPGTGVFHHHAHSVTLWRQAEVRLRTQVRELELSSGGWSSTWEFAD